MTNPKTVIERMKAKAASRIAALPDDVQNIGAHGEITFIRVDALPDDFISDAAQNGEFIVAHSETGHHHVLDADGVEYMADKEDALVAWARIQREHGAPLKHKRANDTHRTLTIAPGLYKIRHARERDLAGEVRRVAD